MEDREQPTNLTRRQLRAMREAQRPDGESPVPDEAQVPAVPGGVPGADAASWTPTAGTPDAGPPGASDEPAHLIAEDTVELPRRLPPEPDVDDVRWEAPLPGVGVRVPLAEREGALPWVAEEWTDGTVVVPRVARPDDGAAQAGEGPPVVGRASGARVPDEPSGGSAADAASGEQAAEVGLRDGGDGGGVTSGPASGAAAGPVVRRRPSWPRLDGAQGEGASGGWPARRGGAGPDDSGEDDGAGDADRADAGPPGHASSSGAPGHASSSGAPGAPGRAPSSSGVGPDAASGGLAAPVEAPLPTLDDLLAQRPEPRTGPAELGWRAVVRKVSGGLISPAPGPAEVERRRAVAEVQRSLDGPRTVVVINPKGGAHKTTATLLIAATFGTHRGGYTLAWDNNETRGTLGWRSEQARHHNTAVNLLQDLERFEDASAARVGDLDNYVRPQRAARFDVLASDEDAASAASIDAFAFRALHRTLSRFYRVMVVDTGNNMRASNWQAAVESADQVVIVSTVREDTAQSAAWAVDALRATGHEDVVRKAVTVLSSPAPRRDEELSARLHEHFGRLTRAVLDVPYDPALVAGTPIDYGALATATKEAWLRVTAAIAAGL